MYSLLVTRRSPVIFFRESESLFEAFAPHMIAHDSCVFLSGLHRKYDREERALIVGGYADPPGVDPQKISACEKPHHHNTRPMENSASRRLSRSYTTPTYENVTITWYRLSRSKVYLSRTLMTFLTPLNQERMDRSIRLIHC